MTVNQIYKLNMVPYAQRTNRTMFPPTVTLSQYDKALRTITFDLYENGDPYLVPENAVVHIFGMKPDGNAFEYEMTIAEDRRRVSVNVQEQMGTVAGDIPGEVVIFESAESDNRIGSANFMFQVEPTVVGDDAQFSESDMPIIQTILFDGEPGDVLMKKANGVEWASDSPSGYMRKSVYDQNNNGIVDNAEKVDGHTVARNVLADEYTNSQIDDALNQKVTKEAGKGLSTNDYTTADKNKLGALPTNDQLTQSLAGKVDKVAGKGLSTNDYTTEEKQKLAGIEAQAQKNVQPDWNQTDAEADDFIKNKPAVDTAEWGKISGNLSDQSDLNVAINAKTYFYTDSEGYGCINYDLFEAVTE